MHLGAHDPLSKVNQATLHHYVTMLVQNTIAGLPVLLRWVFLEKAPSNFADPVDHDAAACSTELLLADCWVCSGILHDRALLKHDLSRSSSIGYS